MYLDHNATSPMGSRVFEAVQHATLEVFGNPSALHARGRSAASAVDKARDQVGALVGRPSNQVYFTSGATEANAWVLRGSTTPSRPVIAASAVEHPSVKKWSTVEIPVTRNGLLDMDGFSRVMRANKGRVGVVSVMAANNETGVMLQIQDAARIARKAGALFHCDATQLPGRCTVDIDADAITLSAHKFGGPMGVGALVTDQVPTPLLRGGGQERGYRAGTLNLPGIVGMGVAAELAQHTMTSALRDRLEVSLAGLPGEIIGQHAPRLPNTTCALFPVPGDMVLMALDMEGIQVSTGSACASGAMKRSATLHAMGFDGIPIRFSFGPQSTEQDLDHLIATLPSVLKRLEGVE